MPFQKFGNVFRRPPVCGILLIQEMLMNRKTVLALSLIAAAAVTAQTQRSSPPNHM